MVPGARVFAKDCDRLRERSGAYVRPRTLLGDNDGRYLSSYVSGKPSNSSSSKVDEKERSRMADENCDCGLAENDELRVGIGCGRPRGELGRP